MLSAEQGQESQSLIDLLEGVRVTGIDDLTIVRPVRRAGEKGYRADWIDLYLAVKGIEPVSHSRRGTLEKFTPSPSVLIRKASEISSNATLVE